MAFGLGGKKKKAAAAAVGDGGTASIAAKPKKVRKPSPYVGFYVVYAATFPFLFAIGALLVHVNMNEEVDPIFNGFFGILWVVLFGAMVLGREEEKRKLPYVPDKSKDKKKEKPPKAEKKKKKYEKKEGKKKDKKKKGGGSWLPSFGGKKKAADDEQSDTDAEEAASEEAVFEESSSEEADAPVEPVAEDPSESSSEEEEFIGGYSETVTNFGDLEEITEDDAEAPAAEANSTPEVLDDPLAGQPVEDVQVDEFDFDAMVGDDLKADTDEKQE